MSATNRGLKLSDTDQYETPAWCVEALVRGMGELGYLGAWIPRSVLDPCAGRGNLLLAAKDRLPTGPTFRAIEIDCKYQSDLRALRGAGQIDGLLIGDALSPEVLRTFPDVDLVVANPPYGGDLPMRFIEAWLPRATVSAWLLRLNWLSSATRNAFLRTHSVDVIVLPRRPSFAACCQGSKTAKRCGRGYPKGTRGKCECGGRIGDGTDACEYAWAIFRRSSIHKLGRHIVADVAWCKDAAA